MKNSKNIKTIGVIMDGNRRYAKSQGREITWGHKEGYATFKKFLTWANNEKIKYVVAYAFSNENWKRSKIEVSALMVLFRKALLEVRNHLKDIGPVSFIGDMSRFPQSLQDLIKEVTKRQKIKKARIYYWHFHMGDVMKLFGR